MTSIKQIDLTRPLVIESAQYKLDESGVVMGVPGTQDIVLTGEDAATFYAWVVSYWQPEFEGNLQSLCSDAVHGPTLTTWMPLVTFREEICCRGLPKQDEAISALMERLRELTREWRAAGVDTVYFHSCRQDTIEPADVSAEQQIAPVELGGALILPARRPDDYRSPRTRDACNDCIDATIQLNTHLAQMAANARRYEKIRSVAGRKDQLTVTIEHDCYTQYVDSAEELDTSIDNLVPTVLHDDHDPVGCSVVTTTVVAR